MSHDPISTDINSERPAALHGVTAGSAARAIGDRAGFPRGPMSLRLNGDSVHIGEEASSVPASMHRPSAPPMRAAVRTSARTCSLEIDDAAPRRHLR